MRAFLIFRIVMEIQGLVLGKCLVAEISNEEVTDDLDTIPMELFDTSTETDIHINEVILKTFSAGNEATSAEVSALKNPGGKTPGMISEEKISKPVTSPAEIKPPLREPNKPGLPKEILPSGDANNNNYNTGSNNNIEKSNKYYEHQEILPAKLPALDKLMDVYVVSAESPGHFIVRTAR